MTKPRQRQVFLSVLLLAVVAALVAHFLGVRVFHITSGSMEPTFSSGSIVVTVNTAASDLKVGDIVTVRRDAQGRLVTHRVVQVSNESGRAELILRGDANTLPDPGRYGVNSAQKYLFHLF